MLADKCTPTLLEAYTWIAYSVKFAEKLLKYKTCFCWPFVFLIFVMNKNKRTRHNMLHGYCGAPLPSYSRQNMLYGYCGAPLPSYSRPNML